MDIKELTELVANHVLKEELESLTLRINCFDGVKEIQGLCEIFKFTTSQNEGWQKIDIPTFNNHNNSKIFFETLNTRIVGLTLGLPTYQNRQGLINKWSELIGEYSITRLNNTIFNYNDPAFQFLQNIIETTEGNEVFSGAYNMLASPNLQMKGQFLATEFLLKDSNIANRIDKERKSIKTLKASLKEDISSMNTHLADYISQSSAKVKDFSVQVDNLIEAKAANFDSWDSNNKSEYSDWLSSSQQNVTNLEELYTEKLRLQAPATYWKDRAKKMNERGNYSLLALVFLVIIGAIIVITVFVNSPANVLPNIAKGDSNAVRWLLVSITAISLITYGIRSLAKIMYSFYHLARDAEEREQLTHLYLALMNDNKVDKDDRSIVLQSLFSRADTGLLKDVSAPTMPGIAVDKLIR